MMVLLFATSFFQGSMVGDMCVSYAVLYCLCSTEHAFRALAMLHVLAAILAVLHRYEFAQCALFVQHGFETFSRLLAHHILHLQSC